MVVLYHLCENVPNLVLSMFSGSLTGCRKSYLGVDPPASSLPLFSRLLFHILGQFWKFFHSYSTTRRVPSLIYVFLSRSYA
jgi:hypothetical protein